MGFFIPAPVALEAQDSTKVSEKRRQLHCCQHDKSFLHSCSSGVKQRLREQLPCSCLHSLPAKTRFFSIQVLCDRTEGHEIIATVRRLELRFCSRPSQKGTAPQPQKWVRFRGPETGPQTAACEVRNKNNLRFVSKIGSFWRPQFWGRQVFNILAKTPATGPPQAAIKQSSTMGFFIPAPVALEAQDSTTVSEKRRQLHCCQHDKSFLHRTSRTCVAFVVCQEVKTPKKKMRDGGF